MWRVFLFYRNEVPIHSLYCLTSSVHAPVPTSLCKNILVFIYAKARILITICLLNACTILKKVYSWRKLKTFVYVLLI